jgi:hypothetical protein
MAANKVPSKFVADAVTVCNPPGENCMGPTTLFLAENLAVTTVPFF